VFSRVSEYRQFFISRWNQKVDLLKLTQLQQFADKVTLSGERHKEMFVGNVQCGGIRTRINRDYLTPAMPRKGGLKRTH
jgi:hypothetical protein